MPIQNTLQELVLPADQEAVDVDVILIRLINEVFSLITLVKYSGMPASILSQ